MIYDLQITVTAALQPCVFCQIDPGTIKIENDLVFAILWRPKNVTQT